MSNIREIWENNRNALAENAEAMRNSQTVSFGLLEAYDRLIDDERVVVHDILTEWLISDDNALRYDAGFLISQRRIKSLKGAIEQAIMVAQNRQGPEAKFEIKKLKRILVELSN